MLEPLRGRVKLDVATIRRRFHFLAAQNAVIKFPISSESRRIVL
jgi:hypothetical protein